MKKQHVSELIWIQSVLFLIIGMVIGGMSWQESRHLLVGVIAVALIAAYFIAKYQLKDFDNAMQYNDKKKR